MEVCNIFVYAKIRKVAAEKEIWYL